MNEYQTLLISALLHDLEKFMQGAWSASFIKYLPEELQDLEQVVLYHHKPESIQDPNFQKIAKILQIADEYSSGEREPREEGEFERRGDTPLISIFSRVDIGRGSLPELHYHELKELEINDVIFPIKEIERLDYGKLWNSFLKEIKTLNYKEFDAYYTALLFILEKYTWCVPSVVYKHLSDVSLYDHLKTTSAIASCLYKYHEDRGDWNSKSVENKDHKKFLLIGGDLSGIQNYIYNIASVGVGGVAKRLRARSFYLGILVDSIMYSLLRKLELPISCNVISSGGNFYILAPNTPRIRKSIEEFKKEIADWLLNKFHGDLYINLGYVEFGGKDFELNQFPKVLDAVNNVIESKKLRKFDEIIVENEKWKDRFLSDISFNGKVCKSCNRMPVTKIEEDTELCELCSFDIKIGRWLLDTKYIAFNSKKSYSLRSLKIFSTNPYYVDLLEKLDSEEYDLVLSLNEVKVLPNQPSGFKFMANHVPVHRDINKLNELCARCKRYGKCEDYYEKIVENNKLKRESIYSFDCIAAASDGEQLLGILKADVDYLGLIFSIGLEREEKELTSISRISTLSRRLDMFFSGWVNRAVHNKFEKCYIVYSGGDDLLIVGPWNEIIKLSKYLNEKFKEYTCNNPNITLSSGIFLCKPKYPIARSSKMTNEDLEKSKFYGRDRITLFETTIEWKEMDKVMEYFEFLDKELQNKKSPITTSFVHRLLKYNRMCIEGDKMYIPLMSYDLARNIMEINKGDELIAIRNQENKLDKLIIIRDNKNKAMEMLKIPIFMALLKNRGIINEPKKSSI